MLIANFSTPVAIEAVPDKMLEVDLALEYWRYLKYRFESYGETLMAEVITAQLAWLSDEPDPKAVLEFNIHHGNKSLRLIDKYGIEQYKKFKPNLRYAVRASRATRSDTSKPIGDTVLAPRSQLKIGQSRPSND
ncbi:MAG: hypothetical protein IPM69_11845 [Ignavibacteria bacterium]|nr:hypothetical protein [Ignavibacteria bacterium]